jgi:hypothetical protein
MGWTAGAIALGAGTSLVGSLFGSKEKASDKAFKEAQTNAYLTGTAGVKDTAAQQTANAGQYRGLGMEAMGMSSPIYQNLLQEYTKQVQNPYAAAAGSIEQASRDVNTQQQQIMQQYGRGPGQQYASAMAQAQIPIFGQQQMTAQRNAGLAGMGGVASAYENRLGTMFNLAGNSLGNAGNSYAGLTQAGAQNRQNYQSPWGQAFGQAGGLAANWMMNKGSSTQGSGTPWMGGQSAYASAVGPMDTYTAPFTPTSNAAKPWGYGGLYGR